MQIAPASAGTARIVPLDPIVDGSLAAARWGGIMLGVLLAIVLLQLSAFAITREASIPWYLGLLASLVAIELVRDGLFPIWRDTPAAMLLVVDLIASIFSAGFAIAYLRLWSERRDLFWWIAVSTSATILVGCVTAFAPGLRGSTEVLRPALVASSGIIILICVVVRAMQFPPGWIFLGGVVGLGASIAYRAVRTVAGTPFLDRWAFEVGATLDALIFAIAIIVRIRYAIGERRAMERSLNQATHDAMHDDLTGVLNRRGLFAQAEHLHTGTLFAIDLDQFKTINDLYGHAAGDAVLLEVAANLRATLREGDLIARIGGDQFVVVAPHTDLQGAKALAERLTTAIEKIKAQGTRSRTIGFGASIGYVALEDLAFENALRLADTHAYRIKQSHRNVQRSAG